MAEDLIPPPSPAGKPVPDGQREELRERRPWEPDEELVLAVRPDDEHPEPVVQEPAVESKYRSRFGFITGALIGVALAAVAIVALLVTAPTDNSERADWSSWKPTATDTYGAIAQIAQHVAFEYRLDDGTQMATIESGPIALNDIPLQVVVRTAPVGGDIIPINGNGVWFIINGLGDHGSIAKGKPSLKRGALVRRLSIELALYTFHYVKDVDHVVTLLPPLPASESTSTASATSPSADTTASDDPPLSALLFRPGDLKTMLEAPLTRSIAANAPRPATMSDREASVLTQFSAGNQFNVSVKSDQLTSGFLILDRPSTSVTSGLQSKTPTPTPTATATATPSATATATP